MHTINEVIITLDEIIASCKSSNSRQAYFATLYRHMTLAVQQSIQAGSFEDAARMEKLDVIFAKRYIDAWHDYQKHQPITQSWSHVFGAAAKRHTVMQHLLLGINTHINLDLSIAAATTSPGESIFQLQDDFDKINDIIATLSNDIQERLSNIWWPMKWLTRISNGSEKAVLNFSIQKARQASWANAVALALVNEEQLQQLHIQQLDTTVFCLGKKIESPGRWAQMLLAPVRWFEYNDVQRVIGTLS